MVAWVAAVALVGPQGEFPLSDDWAYAHAVRSLLEGRGLDLLPWTGATVAMQALYGALVAKAAGAASHEVLRLSTLAAAGGGLLAFHALARRLGAAPREAVAATAVAAFSPLWFQLSFTFMTDVPFAALALAACWLYVRALDGPTPSRAGLLAAAVVTAAAFLVRQHAVFVAGAAALAALAPFRTGRATRATDSNGKTNGASAAGATGETDAVGATGATDGAAAAAAAGPARSTSSRLVDAAAAAGPTALVALAWIAWVAASGDAPLAMHNKAREAAATPWIAVADAAFRGLATLGFLALPWTASLGAPQPGRERRFFVAALAALAGVAAFVALRDGSAMFYLTNVLGDSRVGALTTRDTLFLGGDWTPALPPVARALLTAASLASAALVAARVAVEALRLAPWAEGRHGDGDTPRGGPATDDAQRRPAPNGGPSSNGASSSVGARRARAFAILALVLSAAGTLLQARYYFDRYLVLLLPLAVVATRRPGAAWKPGPAFAAALASMSAYAVAGAHDSMAWNRARWDLLAALEARGAASSSIDGGMEYNASRLAAVLGTSPSDAEARGGRADAKSWWWVVDDAWVVSFTPLDGYREEDARSFRRWLPPGEGRVLALRRVGDIASPAAGAQTGPGAAEPGGSR